MPPAELMSISAENETYPADRSLVERLLVGDGSAWQQFVESYGRLVRSRVADVAATFGRVGDEAAIDDATAEVFAALLRNSGAALRAYAGRSSLATYVAVISTRSATRGFARRCVPAADANENLSQTACDESVVDPVARMIDVEQRQRVQSLLERLPAKQRQLISMFHLQGKSYADISDRLEIPMGSIGPTLRRAEAKLRQWLETD